jgi:hypothetical protein
MPDTERALAGIDPEPVTRWPSTVPGFPPRADDGYLQQALNRGDDGIRLAEAARDVLRDLHVQ